MNRRYMVPDNLVCRQSPLALVQKLNFDRSSLCQHFSTGSGIPDPFQRLRRLAAASSSNDGGSWLSRLSGKPIYVSRHGESEYNVQDRIGGDSPLSPRGELYAKALGRFFNTQGKNSFTIQLL